jgi:hypothetical protein
MTSRLRSNGILINTEISYDLESKEFPIMLKNWERIQSLMGATPESIANLSVVLRICFRLFRLHETEKILKTKWHSRQPIQFFQVLYDSWLAWNKRIREFLSLNLQKYSFFCHLGHIIFSRLIPHSGKAVGCRDEYFFSASVRNLRLV